ncbi:Ferrichrome ABC transporter substrate-binding protein OS=Lysinibacillus sphaericus OX=1421 GN=LS41612_02285 PE=3 SV=1 [Lysinibacillus sphaericus]
MGLDALYMMVQTIIYYFFGLSVPSYLSKYADTTYVNVGSLKEPDFEAISSMSPDIIFISGRQAAAYEELSKIAPTVFVGVDNAKFMESFKTNTELAGKIFGKEKEAADAFAAYEAKVRRMKAKTASSEDKALIVLGSEGSLSAYALVVHVLVLFMMYLV